jgi:hypothetical protein
MSRGLDLDRDDERGLDLRHTPPGVRAPSLPHLEPRDPNHRSPTVPAWHFTLPSGRERSEVFSRRGHFRLRDTESHTLVTVGTFRVVFERDLVEGPYHGDGARLAQDVKSLRAQGLLDRRTIASDENGHTMGVLALTEDGRALLEAQRTGNPDERTQRISHGWRKPAEIIHDASLYRMYQVEAAAIEDRGDHITRVVLDDELKQEIYAVANRQSAASAHDYHRALEDAGRASHVPIVDGHLEFPDVRIEYETASGDRSRVDLELVTAAYRPGQIGGKRAAGFRLYSAHGSARRGIHSLGARGRGGASHEHFLSSLLSL